MRIFFVLLTVSILTAHAELRFERVPEDGVQPQVILDGKGRLHLLYFKGDGMGGDIFYATKTEKAYSKPMQVNKKSESVIVAGTMRGPQMVLGREGRAHIVWMGGTGAEKVQVDGEKVIPLLYTRMNEATTAFEPERNILTHIAGLDGGQTVAADDKGNVYVIWHGAPPRVEGEGARGLYVARSSDDGKTFAREFKAEVPRKGACACCGLRAQTDASGALHVLFRSAESGVDRNELWLKSDDFGKSFALVKDDPWRIGACPASSASLRIADGFSVGAWETSGRVTGTIVKDSGQIPLRAPGNVQQKHPTLAVNKNGDVLLAWVEGAGWGKEGTLVTQVFDKDGKTMGDSMRRPKLPAWSFGAAYAEADGGFVVLY